jgi:mannosyltransferase OCH1-like enzyme
MPSTMLHVLNSTQYLNPDYTLYYFDDYEVELFMSEFSSEVFRLYKKLIPGAFKADFFRVCFLYKYGGCYSDIGHVHLIPFDDICEDNNLVLVQDYPQGHYFGIHNAFMCSVPHHGFFKELIKVISENIRYEIYGENNLDITGPTIVGKVFNCYFHNNCTFKNRRLLQAGITQYDCDLCKIKMLSFERTYINDVYKHVIQCKFDNYYDIMYTSEKIPRYADLWSAKKCFN